MWFHEHALTKRWSDYVLYGAFDDWSSYNQSVRIDTKLAVNAAYLGCGCSTKNEVSLRADTFGKGTDFCQTYPYDGFSVLASVSLMFKTWWSLLLSDVSAVLAFMTCRWPGAGACLQVGFHLCLLWIVVLARWYFGALFMCDGWSQCQTPIGGGASVGVFQMSRQSV